MPVDGLPDRKLHRLCIACRKWFWPEEGVLDYPFATGPLSWLQRRISVHLEDESRMRFYCRACHEAEAKRAEKRRKSTVSGMVALLAMIAAVWAAWALGLFDGLGLPHDHR
jgi:hypothetical protein